MASENREKKPIVIERRRGKDRKKTPRLTKTYDVTIIPATVGIVAETEEPPKKRVAAYCRVSTDQEAQETSLEEQMAHFNTVIAEHPDWELAGIYTDEGISGTQVKHRVQFQQMIEDAKAKKIDLILTKSIILLTVGNLSSVVLTSMDRWFVKALMTTLAFAQYSFAVSMENFMNVAVTPVTTTLYNYFCKATDEVKVRKARNYVMIFAALIVSCAFPARFILEVYLTKYIDSAKVMFLLFAAQIFYIVIKSIYVNLYKAQKKQSIYFIKLTAIIVVGFVFNVICYNLYKAKESFAVGTLLSAVCWYFLCLPDFKWIKYNTKEKLYPFIQTCAFLVCGFCFSAIPGFFIYIFEIMVVTWISFPKETKFIINEAKSKLAHLK